MNLSPSTLELDLAQAVTPPAPAQSKVLVISRTPAISEKMAFEMSADPTVDGNATQGSLASTLKQGFVDWSVLDVVVFELTEDLDDDLRAAQTLLARAGIKLQLIAMSSQPITYQMNTALEGAGVIEVLPISIAASNVDLKQDTPADANGDITIVMRARGGAGATTLAVNMAIAHAQNDTTGKTALVDLDIQNGTVALMLDLPDSAPMSDLVKGEATPGPAFLDHAMQHHTSGLDVLCAPDVFAPLTAISTDAVQQLLTNLKARYDHVIIDMPQAMIDWVDPVMEAAARVVMVSDTSLPSVKRTRRLIELVGEDHMTLPVQVVINGHKRPRVKSAAIVEVERLIGRPLNHWVPADAKSARRATDMGVPLQIGAKRSAAARAISGLAATFLTSKKTGE